MANLMMIRQACLGASRKTARTGEDMLPRVDPNGANTGGLQGPGEIDAEDLVF